MSKEPNRVPEDPLEGALEEFREHERELLDKALARVQRDIPDDATVGEAIREMRRAMFEDDDARALLFRITTLQIQGGGHIRSFFEKNERRSEDLEVKYTSAIPPMSQETIDFMMRLGEEVEQRLPADLSEAEREARVAELLSEDAELAEKASRLERMMMGDEAPPPPEGEDDGGA
jgi:hypothetical protein